MSTINKTIAASGGDYATIQAAFNACIDDGNDYVLTITDHSIYTISSNQFLAARPAGGLVTLQAANFSSSSRPVVAIIPGVDTAMIYSEASIKVNGIKFDYSEPVQGADFRYCIKCHAGVAEFEVSHCQFYMGGRYFFQDSPRIEYGHVGVWAEVNIAKVTVYNCLFRNCGYIGLFVDPARTTDELYVYNNTFVKCQENLWINTIRSTNLIHVYNNLFEIDGTYSPDCIKFYMIYVADNDAPSVIHYLDYNNWYLRAVGHALETWVYYSSNPANRYTTLAAMQAANPTKEIHGISVDPRYKAYCQNYRLQSDSPVLGAALPVVGLVDDNDGYARPALPSTGCFEQFFGIGGQILWK